MKYKLKLAYSERVDRESYGVTKSIESPIFDFPNPIMPGQSITIFGNTYKTFCGDNGEHFIDENGAYTLIDLYEPHLNNGLLPNLPPSELESILAPIKQDFAKLNKASGGK